VYQLPTADEFFSDDYQLPTADEFFDMSPDESSGQAQPPDPAPQGASGDALGAAAGGDPGTAPGDDAGADSGGDTGANPGMNPGSADATATPDAMQPAPGQADGQNPALSTPQSGQTALCPDEAAINVNDPNLKGAHIYAYKDPNDPKGFSFFAVDDKGSAPVTGYFNRTTEANYHELRPGDYTLSPRSHIAVKSSIGGLLQYGHQIWSDNRSGDPNEHEGNPAISNTNDWNTIQLPDGRKMRGAAIHPGRDPITGEGGDSLGCMVTTKKEYNQLNNMLQRNYAQGGAHLHILPYVYFPTTKDTSNYILDPSLLRD